MSEAERPICKANPTLISVNQRKRHLRCVIAFSLPQVEYFWKHEQTQARRERVPDFDEGARHTFAL